MKNTPVVSILLAAPPPFSHPTPSTPPPCFGWREGRKWPFRSTMRVGRMREAGGESEGWMDGGGFVFVFCTKSSRAEHRAVSEAAGELVAEVTRGVGPAPHSHTHAARCASRGRARNNLRKTRVSRVNPPIFFSFLPPSTPRPTVVVVIILSRNGRKLILPCCVAIFRICAAAGG